MHYKKVHIDTVIVTDMDSQFMDISMQKVFDSQVPEYNVSPLLEVRSANQYIIFSYLYTFGNIPCEMYMNWLVRVMFFIWSSEYVFVQVKSNFG